MFYYIYKYSFIIVPFSKFKLKYRFHGDFLVVQCLGLHTFTTEVWGSIPGQEIKVPEATQHGQKKN